jgi:hypothetical protein
MLAMPPTLVCTTSRTSITKAMSLVDAHRLRDCVARPAIFASPCQWVRVFLRRMLQGAHVKPMCDLFVSDEPTKPGTSRMPVPLGHELVD